MQVWEHLKGKQNEAFNVVSSISKWAILSFPYKWAKTGSYGHINKLVISKWSKSYKSFIKSRRVRSRIIYLFKLSKITKRYREIKKIIEKNLKIKNEYTTFNYCGC